MSKFFFPSLIAILCSIAILLNFVVGLPQAPMIVTAAPQTAALVDGSLNPEMIPDNRAFHMVFLAASAGSGAPDNEKNGLKLSSRT